MTSKGAPYPRPLLASARPMGEPSDCTVVPLNVSEFGTITGVAADARTLLEEARQKHGPGGCIIVRTESLFRGFWYNRHAGAEGWVLRGCRCCVPPLPTASRHVSCPAPLPPPLLPCSTAGLQTVAARGMFFAANLEALAQRVADEIGGKYNALHL